MPVKNHHFIKDYGDHQDAKNVRRSAYLVCVLKKQILLDMGAKELSKDLCYIVKPYDELNTGQKCAIIGVSRDWISSLFDTSSQNEMIQSIKNSSDFEEITGIQFLDNSKIAGILHNFISCFNEILQDECVVFNIEPAGKGKLKRIYPCAKITIPGGSMETVDNYSFEECAIREFKEETEIPIIDYSLIKCIKIKNIGRNSSSRFTHFSSATKPVGPQTLFISMYYMIKKPNE